MKQRDRLARPGDVRAKTQLDALYAELPTIACTGECHSSCGPIAMSRVEWARIIKRVGHEPTASGITCPLLVSKRCAVYTIRPMICRLWGLVESMPCPWGCEPEPGYLSHLEGHDFLLRADAISDPEHAEEIEQQREYLRSHPELVSTVTEMFVTKPTR